MLQWFNLRLGRKIGDQSGQGMVEYGLIIALVAVALIAILTTMNGSLTSIFTKVSNTLTSAAS